jgi:hypothetical protein
MHSLDNESGLSTMAADMDAPTPTPARPREYHVLVEGQMHGPFTAESLKSALESGDISQEDLVQVGGLPIWRPLRQIFESTEPRNFASAEAALAATAPSASEAGDDAEPVPARGLEVLSKPSESLFVPRGEAPPDWIVIREWARSRLRADIAQRPVGIGLIFLGVGAVVCIAAHWPFLFWLPWFALAFVSGLSAMTRGKTMQGVGLFVAAGVLPILLSFIMQPRTASTSESEFAEVQGTLAATPAPRPAATPVPNLPDALPNQPAVPIKFESVRPAPGPTPEAAPPKKAPATPAPGPHSSATSPKALSSANTAAFDDSAAVQIPTASTPASVLPPIGEEGDSTLATSAAGSDLVQKHPNSFVVVKDGSASGSGFICRDAQKTWLFTNVHVAAGMRNPQFCRLDGSQIRVSSAEAGGGRDVIRFGIADSAQPLEILSNVDTEARIGDNIVVLGNSGGGGVVTTLPGKLIGVGPDRIEVTAEFIPGNSGSPIVHIPTGKVIGIATYLTKRYDEFTGENSRTAKPAIATVRRFGFRLDGIQKWEPVNWAAFHAEAEQLRQISALTSDVFEFLDAVRQRSEPQFGTDALRRPATEWMTSVRRPKVSEADRNRATQAFLSSLRFMVRTDVAAADNRIRYSYFREQLRKEREVRDRLYKAFDDDVKVMASPSLR